jgi:hypothetical protein
MPCASAKTTSGALAHSAGKAAERLRAGPLAGGEVDDGLQEDDRTALLQERVEAFLDLRPVLLLPQAGLDDRRGGRGEHVHQRLVPGGQLGVGGEAEGAERAVHGAVAQHDRRGHVAADPRNPGDRQAHRQRRRPHVGHDGGQPAGQYVLAEGGLLLQRDPVVEHEGDRGIDDLQVLGAAVHAAEEGHAHAERLPRRPQQVRDLLFALRALLAHVYPHPADRVPGVFQVAALLLHRQVRLRPTD